jgi:hypothetical protein
MCGRGLEGELLFSLFCLVAISSVRHVVTKRTNVTESSSSTQYLDLESDCPQNQTAVRPQSFAATPILEVDQE